jgi:hypothetical protein
VQNFQGSGPIIHEREMRGSGIGTRIDEHPGSDVTCRILVASTLHAAFCMTMADDSYLATICEAAVGSGSKKLGSQDLPAKESAMIWVDPPCHQYQPT